MIRECSMYEEHLVALLRQETAHPLQVIDEEPRRQCNADGEYNQIGCIADHASPLLKDFACLFRSFASASICRCDTPQLLATVWGRQSDRPEFDDSLPQEPERFGRLLPSQTLITSNGSFWIG